MTTVMILHDNPGAADSRFRAVAGEAQSEGESAGAALDALIEQIGDAVADGMFVVVVRNSHSVLIVDSRSPPAPSSLRDRSA
jgi:hypothetical protein